MVKESPPGDVPNLPVTIDLLALAEALERRGSKRKLTGALRNAWRAQSCVADLRQAEGICETLDQTRTRCDGDRRLSRPSRQSASALSPITPGWVDTS